jgi:uncharacterized protein
VSRDLMRYDKMVEEALRGVVRQALVRASETGLPGGHHFYITFRTTHPGVELPDYLQARYPLEMTIVLEHQFWGLEIDEAKFAVTLSFANRAERLVVPLPAITAFADPSVKFGLQFQEAEPAEAKKDAPKLKLAEEGEEAAPAELPAAKPAPLPAPAAAPAAEAEKGEKKPQAGGEVVTLDQFRKK